jgi:hypothetical protein
MFIPAVGGSSALAAPENVGGDSERSTRVQKGNAGA